jgi:hypothetical protein
MAVPFDALVMRAVTHAWDQVLTGGDIASVRQDGPRVYVSGHTADGGRFVLLVVLTPAFRRIQRESAVPKSARPAPWAERILGARIVGTAMPPWERVWRWQLRAEDEMGRTGCLELIVELSGHLTNVLWCRGDGAVGDAYRRVAPGRPGRTVFPGVPYEPPPPVPDPCRGGGLEALPPWARRWVGAGRASLGALCADYDAGRFTPYEGPGPDGRWDVWTYPLTDEWRPASDWNQVLAQVGAANERDRALEDRRRSLLADLDRDIRHLRGRLSEVDTSVDPDRLRRLGDAILAVGPTWAVQDRPANVTDPATAATLAVDWREDDRDYRDPAARAYAAYKKSKAAMEARARLLPQWRRALDDLERRRGVVERASTLRDLDAVGSRTVRAGVPGENPHAPFRRFLGAGGTEIWVGRSEAENQELTFRAARPDDLWFHVKQYPGSHVLLRCGKSPARPQDIQDAAALAAFYSRAGRGSSVPVDYTARKFVKKRPHGQPGQVLYTRERTLYVTPDPDALARLGARREPLAERPSE